MGLLLGLVIEDSFEYSNNADGDAVCSNVFDLSLLAEVSLSATIDITIGTWNIFSYTWEGWTLWSYEKTLYTAELDCTTSTVRALPVSRASNSLPYNIKGHLFVFHGELLCVKPDPPPSGPPTHTNGQSWRTGNLDPSGAQKKLLGTLCEFRNKSLPHLCIFEMLRMKQGI